MSFFTGQKGGYERLPGVPEDALRVSSDYYKKMLSNDDSDFDAFAAPELRRFREQTIPDIAEQFGGANALSSSGFRNSTLNASTDLSERLGELRARLRQNSADSLANIGMSGTGYRQGQGGFADTIGPAVGEIVSEYGPQIGGVIGSAFGPVGTVAGTTIGKGASTLAKGWMNSRNQQTNTQSGFR